MNVMEKWLQNHNIKYVKHEEPSPYYEVISNLDRCEFINFYDCGIFFNKEDLIRIIIPNYSITEMDDYIDKQYPGLFYGLVYCNTGAECIDTVYEEGEYRFLNRKK